MYGCYFVTTLRNKIFDKNERVKIKIHTQMVLRFFAFFLLRIVADFFYVWVQK
jgi:hypothetical protein